jgi:hypothetical protein
MTPDHDNDRTMTMMSSRFLSLYSGGPEILFSAGGGVTVRPPRPATMYALAQRLRARSESQREDQQEDV